MTQSQRIALITGASSGIGRIAAEELATHGYKVFLACRSKEKTQAVIDAIAQRTGDKERAVFLPLELGDLDSVRRCAQDFLARGLPLHLLINNAGLAGQKGMTKSGFEVTFGVCHVGHFLFTQLLLDRLKTSAPARIVNVSSKAHFRATEFSFDIIRRAGSGTVFAEYSQAKLANVLFTKELARRFQGTGVTAYALHPGVVATDVWRAIPKPIAWLLKLRMISEAEGAQTTLYCATDPNIANESGHYYDKCQRIANSSLGEDAALAKRLWEESEKWVA
jgi:retinol dehydrogenase 12